MIEEIVGSVLSADIRCLSLLIREWVEKVRDVQFVVDTLGSTKGVVLVVHMNKEVRIWA